MKKKLNIFILLCFLTFGSLTSCKQSQARPTPLPAYADEGALEVTPATKTVPVKDQSSLLNPNKMDQSGFTLDWNASLMFDDQIRNFYLLGDTVLLESTSNYLHALDRYTGYYKWLIKLNYPLDFAPTLMESEDQKRREIYCIAQNNLYAIDVTRTITGRELGALAWKFPLPVTPTTSPYANEKFVAFGVEEKNFIVAIETHSLNNPDFVPSVISWKRSLDGRISATPGASSDNNNATLMVATEAGKIHGLRFHTGEKLWDFPYYYQAGSFRAPLLVHNKNIFAASTDHTLYVLDRDNGNLLGKVVLDSPLSKTPWAIGQFHIKRGIGEQILGFDDDLDIFVQSDGSLDSPEGHFYHIKVDQIVNRDIDSLEDANESEKVYYRRWILKIQWQLPGAYEYLFRTHHHFYLKKNNEIIVVNRKNGKKVKAIDLGSTPVIVHHDPSSDYKENRLFIATPQGSVYSLQLN